MVTFFYFLAVTLFLFLLTCLKDNADGCTVLHTLHPVGLFEKIGQAHEYHNFDCNNHNSFNFRPFRVSFDTTTGLLHLRFITVESKTKRVYGKLL